MRCWQCGIEADDLHEITELQDPEPTYLARWPAGGDHPHAEHPPSPGELEAAGHEALMRIIWASA